MTKINDDSLQSSKTKKLSPLEKLFIKLLGFGLIIYLTFNLILYAVIVPAYNYVDSFNSERQKIVFVSKDSKKAEAKGVSESSKAQEISSTKTKNGWRLPTEGVFTSPFGDRDNPLESGKQNQFHSGIDFASDDGKIYAAKDGFVVFATFDPNGKCDGGGNFLILKHPEEKKDSIYLHLDSFSEKIKPMADEIGQKDCSNQAWERNKEKWIEVKQGEFIGMQGNTGGSTGPHLHFGIRSLKEDLSFDKLLNPCDEAFECPQVCPKADSRKCSEVKYKFKF